MRTRTPSTSSSSGGLLSFKDMVALSGRAASDEAASRTSTPPETSRFGLYARLLWRGLLEHEHTGRCDR